MSDGPTVIRELQRARRRVEVLLELLTEVARAVERGVPADRRLYELFRERRELGARDRRFISDTVFSFFRWWGWLEAARIGDPVAACLIAGSMDRALPELERRAMAEMTSQTEAVGRLPDLSGRPLAEKGRLLAAVLELSGPLTPRQLFPEWFWDEVCGPESSRREELRLRVAESLQVRPPV